jgi:D-threo-aldose 1-dehydrogenase
MTGTAARPRTLGATGPAVSRLCLGTSNYSRARFGLGPVEPLETVLDLAETGGPPITLIDTSNEYGDGFSEAFVGDALRRRASSPVVVQSKLDRDTETGSFSSRRMWRSLLESTARLGLDRLPMLYLHDPEHIGWEEAFAPDGPVRALVEMKERGLVDAIGISGGPAPMLLRYVETGLFDAVITHNRFTLVDRSADELLSVASARSISVVNAAVYGGGALAKWPAPVERYAYRPADPAMADAIGRMGRACENAGVSLAAAALQASTRDPRVTSTIVGASTAAQVHEAIAADNVEIPEALWAELDALAPSPLLWQDPPGSVWG